MSEPRLGQSLLGRAHGGVGVASSRSASERPTRSYPTPLVVSSSSVCLFFAVWKVVAGVHTRTTETKKEDVKLSGANSDGSEPTAKHVKENASKTTSTESKLVKGVLKDFLKLAKRKNFDAIVEEDLNRATMNIGMSLSTTAAVNVKVTLMPLCE
ncbi:unnamed protein product [Lampetra planeri]